MAEQNQVTIQVKRGVKVDVQEVDKLEGDRAFVAKSPKGLKVAFQQVEATGALAASPSKITMCG